MAPRNWKKPLTLIYDHNYKYGTGLYSGAIDDIERRYLHSMSRTHMSSDRSDLRMSSFASSAIGSSSIPSGLITAATLLSDRGSSLSPYLDTGFTSGLGDLRRVRSVPDMPSYFSEPIRSRSRALIADPFNLEEQARARRRRRRRLTDDQSPLHLPTIPEFSSTLPRQRPSSAAAITDISFLVDKCRQLQSDLETVTHRVTDAEAKLKSEVAGAKSKIEMGLSEIGMELQDSGRQNTELQKVIKRQGRQMSEMQSLYDELHRHMTQATDDLVDSQRRCHSLQSELDSIRHSLDQVAFA